MWRLILAGAIFFPCSAIAQSSSIADLYYGLHNYGIPTCDDLGCDRQVVEPNKALAKYQAQHGAAGAWANRVRNDPRYSQDADDATTCSGAVKALFKLICDDKTNCEIEQEYRNRCLSSDTRSDTQKECVAVVVDYVDRCFGPKSGYREYRGIIGGTLRSRGTNGPFCSAAGLMGWRNPNRRPMSVPVMVTVDHCGTLVEQNETQIRGSWIDHESIAAVSRRAARQTHVKREDGTFDAINSQLRVYVLKGRPHLPMGYMKPEPFAETVFMGFNSLIAMSNMVVDEAYPMVVGSKRGALTYDSSPLCTIVYVNRQKIQHTCQSSMGGSGGALVQKIRDGNGVVVKEGIVAVNAYATTNGQVTENRGVPLLD